MTLKTIATTASWSGGIYTTYFYHSESTSQKLPNGRPDLRAQNPYTLQERTLRKQTQYKAEQFSPPVLSSSDLTSCSAYSSSLTSLNNEVYAKWNGKLRYGSAALGVTLASWRQSRDMINHRANRFSQGLDTVYEILRGNRSARKRFAREREPLAGQVLEGFFGWAPLIEDIRAVTLSVIQHAVPDEWVSASGSRFISQKDVIQDDRNGRDIRTYSGVLKLKYTANVQIDNPNLWLSNRAGLIDLPSVAWDLVPWSFVVNFFSNTSAIIGSLSHRVGLNVYRESVMTKTSAFISRDHYAYHFRNGVQEEWFSVSKRRKVAARPKLTWEARVPDFSWQSAVIAASLVTQKIGRINKILRVI